jgi:hypothetical protein
LCEGTLLLLNLCDSPAFNLLESFEDAFVHCALLVSSEDLADWPVSNRCMIAEQHWFNAQAAEAGADAVVKLSRV